MSAEIVRAACPHDCPDTCGMLVTVEDGVATKIQGDPSMPFTDGTLCTKVAYYLERTYSPDRLLYPMRRVGPKGKGQFERITWDAALDEIAARLKALAAENPETNLPCRDRKSTRLNSSHSQISYAVFCLKKKKNKEVSISRFTNRDDI